MFVAVGVSETFRLCLKGKKGKQKVNVLRAEVAANLCKPAAFLTLKYYLYTRSILI